jgi:hypothetical protein
MKNLKYSWIAIFITILIFTGCSADFLNRPPVDAITDANFYKTDAEVMSATALLYNRVWFDYNDKASYEIGDFRGGTAFNPYNSLGYVKFNLTGDDPDMNAGWDAFFTVIGQSNLAIQNIKKYAGAAVTEPIKTEAIAEARFMRACAYRNLVMCWGPVPIIENNQTVLTDTTIARNTVQSIWRFLTAEMRACANDLPEKGYNVGRVTKWSAEGMLARFYLTRAGVESENGVRNQAFLDSAKYYSDRVIRLSGKSLLPDYASLFKYPYNNNSESLFELEWVYSTIWGVSNSAPAYLAFSPDIANGDGWGGAVGATWWMLQKYEGINAIGTTGDTLKGRTLDQRLHATFMLPGASYPEISQRITLPNGNDSIQRLIYPNNVTAQVSTVAIKKYICGKAADMGGQASSQHYPNDTYMLRLAEMYLIYAEAELGNQTQTSDGTAIAYFNTIHTRAGLGAIVKGFITADDIFNERIIEFSMEGMSMYDLSSLYYYNPTKALAILNSQDRGLFAVYPDVFPNPTQWTFIKTPWDNPNTTPDRLINAYDGNFYLPIPTTELAGSPNLLKPPVDYYNKSK